MSDVVDELLWAAVSGAAPPAWPADLGAGRLFEEAARQRVSTAVARAIVAWAGVPEGVVEAARSVLVAKRAEIDAAVAELLAADRALSAARIDALWVRGPALAAAQGDLYARDPGRDLDVLVAPGHVVAARAVVGPRVDVAAPGADDRGFAELFAAHREVALAGVSVRTLGDPDHERSLRERLSAKGTLGAALDLARLTGERLRR